jgi:ferritin-like metal-binding protein YciE
MGLFSKDIKTMDDLFLHQLKDIYYAEQQIVKNLPTMIDKASSPELKAGFEKHLNETRNQIKRLDDVFAALGKEAKGVDCEAMDGILDEAQSIMSDVDDKEVLDAALVASAQAVEHYEITRYGTLIAWARQLGLTTVVSPLEQNLEEEKATDVKLTGMAESQINRRAA